MKRKVELQKSKVNGEYEKMTFSGKVNSIRKGIWIWEVLINYGKDAYPLTRYF